MYYAGPVVDQLAIHSGFGVQDQLVLDLVSRAVGPIYYILHTIYYIRYTIYDIRYTMYYTYTIHTTCIHSMYYIYYTSTVQYNV